MQAIKVMSVVVIAGLFMIGCGGSKYKTFQEEAADLNRQYMEQVSPIFKQAKKERNAALEQAQATYDQAFSEIATKWKVDAKTAKEHLNFKSEFCKQTIQDPYDAQVNEIVNQYTDDFKKAVTSLDEKKVEDISTKIGMEFGTVTAVYKQKAKSAECPFQQPSGKEVVESLFEQM